MAKTIKQIADNLGLDKQKVYRYIKKNHINELHQNGQVMWFDDAVEIRIKKAFSNETTSNELHHEAVQTASFDTVLLEQIKLLSKQLEEKDRQISNLQKLADQAQQLQAIAENKIKLLEQNNQHLSEQVVSRSNSEDHSEVKKGFFARLFGGKS